MAANPSWTAVLTGISTWASGRWGTKSTGLVHPRAAGTEVGYPERAPTGPEAQLREAINPLETGNLLLIYVNSSDAKHHLAKSSRRLSAGFSLQNTQPLFSGSQTADRIVATILLAISGLIVSVQPSRCDDLVGEGGQIAASLCSECHAVAGPGPSPVEGAPVFSTLGHVVNIDDLAEALAEGNLTGHGPVEMPEFTLEPEEIDALLAYLHSIQK
jgi:mono/diheme cytochrome c family protein